MRCWRLLISLLLIARLPNIIYGAKILFISPSITNSIVMFTGRMADLLVEAGHDVTFWIPEVVKTNRVNGTRLARIVRMDNITDSFTDIVKGADFFQDLSSSIMLRMGVNDALYDICEGILKRSDELEELRRENFDLAFSDNTELCFVGLAHYLGAKQHIYISTGEFADATTWIGGIPQPVGAVPCFEDTLVGPKMNFWDRAHNTYSYVLGWLLTAYQFRQQNKLFRRYAGEDFPPLEMLLRESPLWFKASDPFIAPAVPTLDKVINIAGVGIPRQVNLTSEILETVLRGRKGAVFFSLGTVTPTTTLCVEKRRALFDAFAAFPDYQFIVKVSWDDEISANLSRHIANIQLVHWAPQADLLDHEHVKLFISHGGMNSVFESAIRGVPMITIPLFFDQFRNAKGVEYRGYGRILERKNLTTDNIRRLIAEMLNNPKYAKNAQRLSRLYWNKPYQPDEEVRRWTNFVLEHGPLPELTPHGAHLNLIHYFCLDIFALAAIAGVTIIFTVLWLVIRVYAIVARRFMAPVYAPKYQKRE